MQTVCILGYGATGIALVSETLRVLKESSIFSDDYGLLRRAAFIETEFGDANNIFLDESFANSEGTGIPTGIWQMTNDMLSRTKGVESLADIYDQIRERLFGILWDSVTFDDLNRPLHAALAVRLYLYVLEADIPRGLQLQSRFWYEVYHKETDDFIIVPAAQNFASNLPYPADTDDGNTGKCVYGIIDSDTCECTCDRGWMGEECNVPNCNDEFNCAGASQCSGISNGICIIGERGRPQCRCTPGSEWVGPCCSICRPVMSNGDPHLQTIDGFPYDYFGIGLFASCYSIPNDFGVQLMFFKYKHASMVGGAALRIGGGVATVTTTKRWDLPRLRINGTEEKYKIGDNMTLVDKAVTLAIGQGAADNCVAEFFFQFHNGAAYKIHVRYSENIGRQYIDASLGAPIPFMMTTIGLCGNMDGNRYNDFIGPDGTTYDNDNVDDFVVSWRLTRSPAADFGCGPGCSWSWNHSNFYPGDLLDSDYDINTVSHQPVYGENIFRDIDIQRIQAANTSCLRVGLTDKKLQDCMIDFLLTEDTAFLDQQAFFIGSCPDDCSNHGDCVGGVYCNCSGLWRGENCGQGGCDDCVENSECIEGFCVCEFGYYEDDGLCLKANCDNVNNCTSPANGQCRGPDDCLCNPGFIGADCSISAICSDDCSGHGACTDGGQCICDPNWGGERCGVPTCEDFQGCLGNGNCTNEGTCVCDAEWTGPNCAIAICFNMTDRNKTVCSGRGRCVKPNRCLCDKGYIGMNCEVPLFCPTVANCSGNGMCVSETECICYEGFSGKNCDRPDCPNNCNGRGRCISVNFCKCDEGWTGGNCSQPSCLDIKFCSGHGVCVGPNLCRCDEFWEGTSCDSPFCPVEEHDSAECSGNGNCIGPGVCECDENHHGTACEQRVILSIVSTPMDIARRFEGRLIDIGSNASNLLTEQNVVLSCYVKSSPPAILRIYKDGQFLKEEQMEKGIFLQFSNLSISDAGHYRCKANNTLRSESGESVLTVSQPPTITGITISPSDAPVWDNVSTVVGDRIAMQCKASGYPKPVISWTIRTNTAVETLSGVAVRDSTQELVIPSARKIHGNQYSCIARNRAGEAQQTLEVMVLDCISRSRGCSGNGNCGTYGSCDCDEGWRGSNCSVSVCYGNDANSPLSCSGNGRCVQPDWCTCDAKHTGRQCEFLLFCPAVSSCNGNGMCLSETACACFQGFTGTECETLLCPTNCSGRGTCIDNDLCQCNDGWTANDCSVPSCTLRNSCSGHGRCIGPNRCECDDYWKGLSCDTPSCPVGRHNIVECSGNGLCVGPGVCKCNKNYIGSSCEERVMLRISSTPQDVSKTLSEETGDRVIDVGVGADNVVTGQNVLLSCYVESYPPANVQFFKDGISVLVEHREVGNATFIYLLAVTLSDAGKYRCVANNTVSVQTRESHISVSEPPHITTFSQSGEFSIGEDVIVAVGGRIALRCDATGYPPPSRIWTVANGLPVNSTMAQITIQDNGAVLVISDATMVHSNRYTCTAKNIAGETSKSSVLTVGNCVSSVRHLSHPKCVVTILLLEETAYIKSVFTSTSGALLQKLEEGLIDRGIGVNESNRYGIVAFGSRRGPRVLQSGSPLTDLFSVKDVHDAVRQLKSDSVRDDADKAIVYALTEIEMERNVKDDCLTSFLLATTNSFRLGPVNVDRQALESTLCRHQPAIVNSLLNVRFTTTTSSRRAMGVDWMGNTYIALSRSNAVTSREEVRFSPSYFSTCKSMSVYGQLGLDFHGAVWDATYFLSMQNALVNATLLSVSQMTPCEECTCSETGLSGGCTYIKNPNYCQCRKEGKTAKKCRRQTDKACVASTGEKAFIKAPSLCTES
jgi:hypothetical protein